MDPARREEILRAYVGHARRFEEIATKLHRRESRLASDEQDAAAQDDAARAPEPATDVLSGREQAVLACVAEGLSNAEIGAKLHITEETVKSHVQRILRRLNARNRAHAVWLGCTIGLLSESSSPAPTASQ